MQIRRYKPENLPAIRFMAASIAAGSMTNGALVILGATRIGALTGAVWIAATGTALIWIKNKPALRAGWPVWKQAFILGAASATGAICWQSALRALPLAVMVPTAYVTGPMLLSVLEARRWRDRAWPVIGFFGVAFLAPAWEGRIDYLGFVWVSVNGVAYITYAKVMSELPKGDVDDCTTLSRLPYLLLLVMSATAVEGAAKIVGLSWTNLVIFVGAGVGSSWLPMVLSNAAWQRELRRYEYALLAPIDSVIGVGLGLFAGQWPSLRAWFGIGMILVSAFGLGLAKRNMHPN